MASSEKKKKIIMASSEEEKIIASSKKKKIMLSSRERTREGEHAVYPQQYTTAPVEPKTREVAQNVNPPQYMATPAQPQGCLHVSYGYGVPQLQYVPLHYQQPLPHQPYQYQQPFPQQQHQLYQPQGQYQQIPVSTGMQPPGSVLAKPAVTPKIVTTDNQAVGGRHNEEKGVLLSNAVIEKQVCSPRRVEFETVPTRAQAVGRLKGWDGEKKKRRREVERNKKVGEELERKRIEGIMKRMTESLLNNFVAPKVPRQNPKHSALKATSISSKSGDESSCEWKSEETAPQFNQKRIRCDDNSAIEEKSKMLDLRFNKDDTKSWNQAKAEGVITIGAPEVWDEKAAKVSTGNIRAYTRTSSSREREELLSLSSEEQPSTGLIGAGAGLSAFAAVCDKNNETHATGPVLSENDDCSLHIPAGKQDLLAAAAFARRMPEGAKTEVQEDGITTPIKRAEVPRKSTTSEKSVTSPRRIPACRKVTAEAAAFARLHDIATVEVQEDGIATIVPIKRATSSTKPPAGKKSNSANVVARAKTKANQSFSQAAASNQVQATLPLATIVPIKRAKVARKSVAGKKKPVMSPRRIPACRKDTVEAAAFARRLPDKATVEVQEDGITTIVPFKRATSSKTPAGKKSNSANVLARAKTKANQSLSQAAASNQAQAALPLGLQVQTSQIAWGQPAYANPVNGHSQMMQGQAMSTGQAITFGIAQSQYGMPQPYVYHQPPTNAVHYNQLAQPVPAMQVHLGVQQTVTPVQGAPTACAVTSNPAPAQGVNAFNRQHHSVDGHPHRY